MTRPEEALKILNSRCLATTEKDRQADALAIEALEKQIPKEPKMPLDAYWVCPICGRNVKHPFEHCTSCGQTINWLKEKE